MLDTPISESAFIGAAVGSACSGLRPVAELMFVDFMGVCFDQIFNQGAKLRYMFGGKARVPMVIRTMWGAGIRAASQHSQSLYSIFTHVPGLKVAVPSTPYDAKGLLIAAIRDDDPVIFFENKVLYTVEGEGRMVGMAEQAAERLAGDGIDCEVVDLRTTSPLDTDTVYETVEKTGRLVVVDEDNPRCGMAADIAALVAQNCFDDLQAPVQMVTAPHTPPPFTGSLEDLYVPSADKIGEAVRRTTGGKVGAGA